MIVHGPTKGFENLLQFKKGIFISTKRLQVFQMVLRAPSLKTRQNGSREKLCI